MPRSRVNARSIGSRSAKIDGIKLHYLTTGHGAPLILLHGYAQTSRMWKAIMPRLAEHFMVIAPDLPGIGDSAIPSGGLDMKTAADESTLWHARWDIQKALRGGT